MGVYGLSDTPKTGMTTRTPAVLILRKYHQSLRDGGSTALHCLNSSMCANVYCKGRFGTPLEWADELLSKKWECVDGWSG